MYIYMWISTYSKDTLLLIFYLFAVAARIEFRYGLIKVGPRAERVKLALEQRLSCIRFNAGPVSATLDEH